MIRCMICGKEIRENQVPKEALQNIGLQVMWHEECLQKLDA